MDIAIKRTRLIGKQQPETLTEHADAADHEESQAIEDRYDVNEKMLAQINLDVIIHAIEHSSSGLWTMTALLSEQPKQLVCGAVTSEFSCQVMPPDLSWNCVVLGWRTLVDRHAMPSEVRHEQIGAVIQRTGEVSTTELNADQQRNMRDAMTRQWLKYHAVKGALRCQFTTKDVM